MTFPPTLNVLRVPNVTATSLKDSARILKEAVASLADRQDTDRILRAVAEAVPAASVTIYTVNPDGTYTYIFANGEAIRWSGYEGVNMVGSRVDEALTPESMHICSPFFEDTRKGCTRREVITGENDRQYILIATPHRDPRAGHLGIMIAIDVDRIFEVISELRPVPLR